jgi:acetyl-CoA carboxylase carboxyl transferase subunit beta
MGWLITEPGAEKKKSVRNIWIKCKNCQSYIFENEWKNNLNVCPKCNYHDSMTSSERISLLIDPHTFEELFHTISPVDSLGIPGSEGELCR